jgi:hypothetical protein
MPNSAILLATCALLAAVPATAQHAGHHGADASPLTEPGQGAFAALSEVVAQLEADPTTDWGSVDLGALRDHLIDMDRLVRDADVTSVAVPGGLRMRVTGDAATLATARRMVPAHAAELARDARWTAASEEEGEAVVLQVTSDDPATGARIRALGFFGLMASQDHHRAHHWQIATGQDVH